MILGIGTDIVRVARMQAALDRYGERFARRILTEQELSGFAGSPRPAHYLAKRFAAKEALVKALGTGFRDGIGLRQIGVGHDPLGKPVLVFDGRVRELMDRLGAGEGLLSLADEQDYAIAFVTVMRRPGGGSV